MRKLLALLLIAVIAIGIMTPVTLAADNELVIFVEGIQVNDADVEFDGMGDFYFPKGVESAKTVFKDVNWDEPGMPTSTSAISVEHMAEQLGYTFQQNGIMGYLTKNGLLFRQNDKAVIVDHYWEDNEVLVGIWVLYEFFENEIGKTTLPSIGLYDFTAYAESYGYKVTRYENYYWFRNDGMKPIMIDLDGETVFCQDQQPVIKEGRTLIPIGMVISALGGQAIWDDTEKSAAITYGSTTIKIIIGEKDYYLNGEKLTMDVPAEIINGRTMIPLGITGEALGYDMQWDPGTDINWIHLDKK